MGYRDCEFLIKELLLRGIQFAFINDMKPIINFVLRSAIITFNQDMAVFKDLMSVEQIQSFIKVIRKKK